MQASILYAEGNGYGEISIQAVRKKQGVSSRGVRRRNEINFLSAEHCSLMVFHLVNQFLRITGFFCPSCLNSRSASDHKLINKKAANYLVIHVGHFVRFFLFFFSFIFSSFTIPSQPTVQSTDSISVLNLTSSTLVAPTLNSSTGACSSDPAEVRQSKFCIVSSATVLEKHR